MLRLTHWKISADLRNDQPLDACGYIAADAVCRLRDAALSEANSWHDMQLPDYSQLSCISRGMEVLQKRGDERILETDEVNRLVRHYSHLDLRHQASEEWWALLQSTPNAARMQTRFAPAWKARRSELEVLADRAQKKHDDAKRIGVIHDTTSFKGVRLPRTANVLDAATKHVFEV